MLRRIRIWCYLANRSLRGMTPEERREWLDELNDLTV